MQYQYVECLMDLDKRRYDRYIIVSVCSNHLDRNEHNAAQQALRELSSAYPPPHGLHQLLVKANRNIRTALGALERMERQAVQIENQLQVRDRWDSSSAEYKGVEQGMAQRQYRLALDELECLVVQRLFELMKLNTSGTGELCTKLPNIC